MNRHAFGSFVQQQIAQALTEAVVMDDEELDQYGFARLAMASKIASKVAWPLISSCTSLFARHGIPSLGMARSEA
jgi:hypothetical protein